MIGKYMEIDSWSLNQKVDVGLVIPSKIRRILIFLHGYGGNIEEVFKAFPLKEYSEKYKMVIAVPELGNQYYLDRCDTKGEKDYIVSDFLCEELPIIIMNEYMLKKDTDVLLGGYSMGGFGVMLHGLQNMHCFKALISVSGAFIADEIAIGSKFVVGTEKQRELAFETFMIKEGEFPIDVLLDDVKRNPAAILRTISMKEKTQIPQIVMTCAKKDIWCSTTRRMKAIMEKLGIPFCYNESIDGEHDFVEFDKGFRYAFQKIFEY